MSLQKVYIPNMMDENPNKIIAKVTQYDTEVLKLLLLGMSVSPILHATFLSTRLFARAPDLMRNIAIPIAKKSTPIIT